MNRENKRKQFQNGYYKNHRCDDTFTCKHCGRVVVPIGAGTQHRNHCPNCLTSLHLDDDPGDRAADCGGQMSRWPSGCAKAASGPSSTAAGCAASWHPTALPPTITR